MPFVLADDNLTVGDSDDEGSKIDKAYECLRNKIDGKCDSLSLEEKIFSLLAVGECRNELIEDSEDAECWPDNDCAIKPTAQAILALSEAGTDTSDAEKWLISQNQTPENMDWFLQIESSDATTCTITYDDNSYQISIGADRKINSGAGSCLSLSEGGWWLRISPGCYEQEFAIKCHESSFLTNLFFKKTTSSTIHILEQTTSAAAEGTTYEKVNSACFADHGSCDYEGSLWAALVLHHLGQDISAYLPYLISIADDNEEYLPEAFLYLLTNEYRTDILSKQINNEYWDESGDKFYDTALALYGFSDEPSEKSNAKDWLLEVQDSDGCWQGNIRNTAFILYSIWPKEIYEDDDDDFDCEDMGYYCISGISCQEAGGDELDYSCSGLFVCCDRDRVLETCKNQGGEVCNSAEICMGGTTVDASDLSYGETCCVDGRCEIPSQAQSCEDNFGICRTSCNKDEEESLKYECDYGDICCMKKAKPEGSYLWIWILLIFIALIIVGIIFKDKLRTYWFRLKSKFGKSGKPRGGPTTPLFPAPGRRVMPRKILPPQRHQVRRPMPKPRAKPKPELDEVLKKLKEMGK